MKKILFISALATVASASFGQAVNINSFVATPYTGTGTPGGYFENFDTKLGLTGDSTLTVAAGGRLTQKNLGEWSYRAANASGTVNSVNLIASTNTSSAGGFYNVASGNSATNTDRALGSLGSGTNGSNNFHYGLSVINNTGTSTGLAVVGFALEQWRTASASGGGTGYTLSFAVYKNGSTFQPADLTATDGRWKTAININTSALGDYSDMGAYTSTNTLAAPNTSSTLATVNSGLAANRVVARAHLNLNTAGLLWEQGDELVIRFTDPGGSNARGLSIDNIQVVPEPASMAVLGLGILGLARRRRNK